MRLTETWIDDEQQVRRLHGLERQLTAWNRTGPLLELGGRTVLNFSSNDYLGLARHPHVLKRAGEALQRYGAGATASRLVVGSLDCHDELEARLAGLKGYPAALVFGSGFAANLGLVGALVGREDHVFIDRLAHASLVDAAVLSRAKVHRFQHNESPHLDRLLAGAPGKGRRLVLTESVFSMDGDLAPLADIARIAEQQGAMVLVDEAHATGVFGPRGAGRVRAEGVEALVNLSMGTLSKALGGGGGFVACSEAMRVRLINHARTFVYSTAIPPVMVGAALGALEVMEREPDLGARLLSRAEKFRLRLQSAGVVTGDSVSQIIPVMIGDNERAMRLHRRLLDEGLLVVPIRPPTVPPGSARLRLSIMLDHTDEALDQAAELIIKGMQAEGLL
jgi:8-amino-7-oxononanoate synthase